jgi:hypothetical protein
MASGHVNRIQKAAHMAAPTNAAYVKKALANPEPSTHGPIRPFAAGRDMSEVGGKSEVLVVRSKRRV